MTVKEYLEKSEGHLIFPESYNPKQIEEIKEILKMFNPIDITTKEHQRLRVTDLPHRDSKENIDGRTIVIDPVEEDCITKVEITSPVPDDYFPEAVEKEGWCIMLAPHRFKADDGVLYALIIQGVSFKEEKWPYRVKRRIE